ncbi:universal stress protein, partial [Pseudonocardia sp. RS11V-5]|nr:universal stress protein [Pseudonocardia terrae]
MTATAPVRPVLVLDDGGTVAGIAAQRWAAAEASRRELPLQLVGTQADGVHAVRRLRGEYPRLPEEVLRTAVDEALERDAELVAVRAWRAGGRGLRDLARLLPGPFGADRVLGGRGDGAGDTAEEAQRELDQLLSPWRIGYPELRLHPLVVLGDLPPVLTMLSVDAELLVVGRSGRGALLRAVAGA